MSLEKKKRNKGKERRERKLAQKKLSHDAALVAASEERIVVQGKGKTRREYREKFRGGCPVQVDNPDFDPDQEESAENKRKRTVWVGGGIQRVRVK